jgi:hypothetical protein
MNTLQIGASLSAPEQHLRLITRRKFFQHCGTGMGALALASLLNENLFAAVDDSSGSNAVKGPHFAPRAKNIIYLFMSGAPSQLDLFDYKPELAKLEGKPLPPSVIGNQRYAFIRSDAAVMGPRWP